MLKISNDLKLGPENFRSLKIRNNKLNLFDIDDKFLKEVKSIQEVKELSKDITQGLDGEEYNKINLIENIKNAYEIVQYIKLFYEITPIQKNKIIKDLIKSGRIPSMCGDGSNDIGALRLATIGVVLLNIKETKIQKKEPFNFLQYDDEATIKNWDATSVAHFTSKSDSIKCIKNIFVQGRCALVTNIQMYKIFILNSLLTTYIESVLMLKGIKFSNYQSVYLGFAVSMFFLMLSKAKHLRKVNSNRPPISIFNYGCFFSIVGQCIIHLIVIHLILYVNQKVELFPIGQEKSLDEKFTPNLINTVMFLFQILNQTIIFIVNYQGELFMENILENSSMTKLIGGIFVVAIIIIFDLYPQLNEDFELVSLPEDNIYKLKLFSIMLFNFIGCYVLEK